MKRNRWLGGLAVAALALTVAGAMALAGPGGQGAGRGASDAPGAGKPGMGPGSRTSTMDRMDRMAERLGLTEEQRSSIEKIQESARTAQIENRKKLMRLENDLRGEMLKDEPSKKAALDLVQQMGQVRTAMQTQRMETRFAVREVLTKEQRAKFFMGFEGRRGGDRGGRGHGARRGDGPRMGRRGGQQWGDGPGLRWRDDGGSRWSRPGCPGW
jgi:Spy/CpxP family protein refolding chaperone